MPPDHPFGGLAAIYRTACAIFDYDMIYTGWVQSLSPGNEQRYFFGIGGTVTTARRTMPASPTRAVDALVDKIVFATNRDTLIAATRALDRVLLAHHYAVPTYTLRKSRIARWDRFSHPETLPEFSIGFPTVWWYDEAKAAKTGAAKN
jgi:microcin C transport system substrate-binding protein